ncbi:MAG: S8 family serine peptidase, partial [Actinobacteria bacterium]|nr:S8 family serine peptidase [Actinomycetota bacterium]
NGHGTEMAMLMAAPQNGWGMVGIAPTAVRVYSVRVVPPGGTTFGLPSYSYAMARCEVLRGTTVPGLTVVNLSLGGTATPTTDEVTFIKESVDEARFHGLNVVAAAGNEGSVLFPASYPPVVAVGAGDAHVPDAGALCSFSKAATLDLIAPGCDGVAGGIDEVFEDDGTPALAFGTSQAAALTSGVLAAMRAYGPTLSADDAEHCLTSTAINGGNLNVEGAFRACGLARIVREGVAGIPLAKASTGPVAVDPPAPAIPSRSQPVSRRMATPRIARAGLRRGRLVVTVLNRPLAASVEVRALDRRHRVIAVRTARSSRISLRATNAYYVIVRFVVPGSKVRSAWALRRIT